MKSVEPGQTWRDCDVSVVTLYPRSDIDKLHTNELWRWTGTWQCLIVEHDEPDMLGQDRFYSIGDDRSDWTRVL